MSAEATFTSADLADFAAEHGAGIPLLISSHGETYGIGGFSWNPDEKVIYLASACPFDLPAGAVSVEGDPEATARARRYLAEELAGHLEDIAARVRAKYPGSRS